MDTSASSYGGALERAAATEGLREREPWHIVNGNQPQIPAFQDPLRVDGHVDIASAQHRSVAL